MKRRYNYTSYWQLCNFLVSHTKMPQTQFETGMLIVSVDVDVGSRMLGVLNKGQNDANVSSYFSEYIVGKIEERALLMLINLLNDFEIPSTFAIRGQLLQVDGSIIDFLRDSSVKHDIGAHGYYHVEFPSLSNNEAENELKRINEEMKKFGVTPRSFVFPRNLVAHLDLLMKYGYKCYRGAGGFLKDRMYIERRGPLFNICPSMYVCQGLNSHLIRRSLDLAVIRRLPFHVWFHIWNFGQEYKDIKKSIDKILVPLLDYAKKKKEIGMLTFETMLSAANKAEKYLDSKVEAKKWIETEK